MRAFLSIGAAALFLQALAHSWIEQLVNIDDDGKFVGEFGYPRSFQDKSSPTFKNDAGIVFLSPPNKRIFIQADDPLCHPDQRTPKQSDKFPRLKTTPGSFVALRYAENGHVSQPDQTPGRPAKSGTTFVFGTTEPIENEKLADVLKWTADGKGGDKRGVLLTAQNFDDGRCYEISSFPIAQERKAKFPNFAQGQVSNGPGNYPLMCETDVQIPKEAVSGKPYTLYWVWQWPQGKGTVGLPDGKDEYYTTCMDVDVADVVKQDAQPSFKLLQQDAVGKAVNNWNSRTAVTTDPIKGEMGDVFGSPTATGSSAAKTSAVKTGAPAKTSPIKTGLPAETTLQTSVKQSLTTSDKLPVITDRPKNRPTNKPGLEDGDADTVVVTERVTVTAPAAVKTVSARAVDMDVEKRGSAKFRGKFY